MKERRLVRRFEAFEKQHKKARYAEWISRGTIPDSGSYGRVPVESLLGFVDVATDSKKRVILRNDASNSGWMNEFALAPIDELATAPGQEFAKCEPKIPDGGESEPLDW